MSEKSVYNVRQLYLIVYDKQLSTKAHKQERQTGRSTARAPSHHLDMATKQIGMQEPFLANTSNKKGFIVLLKHMSTCGGESGSSWLLYGLTRNIVRQIAQSAKSYRLQTSDIIVTVTSGGVILLRSWETKPKKRR